jgi:hypothetical protein
MVHFGLREASGDRDCGRRSPIEYEQTVDENGNVQNSEGTAPHLDSKNDPKNGEQVKSEVAVSYQVRLVAVYLVLFFYIL